MNPIASLRDLAPARTRAVIINCGTKWVTSLALLAVLRYTDYPALVIDCESRDGSAPHFRALAKRFSLRFDWLAWPLRSHPAALDELFATAPFELTLLVDSDLEIRERAVVDAMAAALAADPQAYGAGFLHGPNWLGTEHGLPPYTGYYAERMWIPCVLMRNEPVRRALLDGCSFANRRPFFEVRGGERLSRIVGLRHRIRGLRRLRAPAALRPIDAPQFEGRRPAFVEYDTGADLHRAMQARGHPFACLPDRLWGDVHHFHGVTRATRAGLFRRMAKVMRLASTQTETEQSAVIEDVLKRLADHYQVADAGTGL